MKNERLQALAQGLVHQFGYDHCSRYLYPLSFFVSATEEPIVENICARGLSQNAVQSEMEEILREDSHLRKCCGDVWHLAQALDILFFRKLSAWHFQADVPLHSAQPDFLDGPFHELDAQLYGQGDFEKYACFHLFNIKFMPEHAIEVPYEGWVIKQLENSAVPRLLGESSFQSFVSPPSTGTWFLISKDTTGFDGEQLYDWLARRWREAQPFRQVIQYSVDGISDIDYVVPHFSPDWVNQIQKGGVYFLGSPRRDVIPAGLCPQLTTEAQQEINRMWRAYSCHRERIIATGSTLRKAIRIAGEFFGDYHRKTGRTEQLANLMIALEALFTPSDQNEQTFRISQNCALLACKSDDSSGRQEVFEFLKQMFRRRGKLFHGQFDSETESPEKLASDEDINRLASLVRKSILRLLAIYLQGENDLEGLRKQFQRAALDDVLRDELLTKADIESFIDDSQTSLL